MFAFLMGVLKAIRNSLQPTPPADVQGSLALQPVDIPILPDKLPVLNVTLEAFTINTQRVIEGLEGGYYHPDMKKNFSAKSQKLLGDSGETMYGLDRKHGAQLAKFSEWNEFWKVLDQDKKLNPNRYGYNKMDVPQAATLKRLAAAIMYKWFSYLAGKYLLVSSMDEVAADDRLMIHFSYASWNGEGWFERYAKALNEAIRKYDNQPNEKELIFKEAIKARTESSNAVIRQQGTNMMALFKKLNLV